jgi:hypothetical protein
MSGDGTVVKCSDQVYGHYRWRIDCRCESRLKVDVLIPSIVEVGKNTLFKSELVNEMLTAITS